MISQSTSIIQKEIEDIWVPNYLQSPVLIKRFWYTSTLEFFARIFKKSNLTGESLKDLKGEIDTDIDLGNTKNGNSLPN